MACVLLICPRIVLGLVEGCPEIPTGSHSLEDVGNLSIMKENSVCLLTIKMFAPALPSHGKVCEVPPLPPEMLFDKEFSLIFIDRLHISSKAKEGAAARANKSPLPPPATEFRPRASLTARQTRTDCARREEGRGVECGPASRSSARGRRAAIRSRPWGARTRH